MTLKVKAVKTGKYVPLFQRKYLLETYPNDAAVNSSATMVYTYQTTRYNTPTLGLQFLRI